MPKIARPLHNVQKIVCPWCKNPHIVITLNFVKKWSGDENNLGFCIRTVIKSTFGLTKIQGCGKTFKIEILPRKSLKFPAL